MANVPIKERKGRKPRQARRTHREDSHVKTEAEAGTGHPQAGERLQLPAAAGGKGGSISDNVFLLFEASKFMIICYTSNRTLI